LLSRRRGEGEKKIHNDKYREKERKNRKLVLMILEKAKREMTQRGKKQTREKG